MLVYSPYQPHVEDVLWPVCPHVGVQDQVAVSSIELAKEAGVKLLKFMLLDTPDLSD